MFDVPRVVERAAHGGDLAVHHPARAEQVGAGVGLRARHRRVAHAASRRCRPSPRSSSTPQ